MPIRCSSTGRYIRELQRRAAPCMLLALLGVILTGCGQTGPLYLPQERGDVIIREATPQTGAPAPSTASSTPAPTP